jgi:hypothetical protein
MSYEIKITDLLERRIKVKRNEQSVGNIDPGETKAFTCELKDVFNIDETQTRLTSKTPYIKIFTSIGYHLSFSGKGGLKKWEIDITGPIPSPETDVNVTVGEDEPPE